MKGRAGITLVEVLITILVMGVGMLSVLVLFPVGILNMRQAMQDDRAANMGANGDMIVQALSLRNGNNLVPANPLFTMSTVAYVDPFYQAIPGAGNLGASGVTTGIPRFGVTPLGGPIRPTRWFTLEDDIDFNLNGLADTSNGSVTGGGEYTMAFLLKLESRVPYYVDLNVVVYKGRTTRVAEGEVVYQIPAGNGVQGTNTLKIPYGGALPAPALRKSGWVLDVSQPQGAPNAYFYRVVNYTDDPNPPAGMQQVIAETQTPLQATVTTLVVMENVIEVFERTGGTGH